MNGTWTVDMEDSFDRTAKKDSRDVELPLSVEMTIEGAFTCVIYLIAHWPIPPTLFRIRLRWNSRPMAQLPGLQVWHNFHFDGNHERDRGLIR